MTDVVDEARHPPGGDRWWNESWYFDFAAPDASVGGYVRLGLYPNQQTAWWWAYLIGADRGLVALRAHDIPIPRAGTEFRDDGIWACLTAETPLDHWSVGMEAFAVMLDDPADAYHGERGHRVPFGLDLEWEAVAPAFDYPGVTRYEQSCRVHGEVLVGDERIAVDAPGQRDHSWGVRDWWQFGWCWTAGALEDGTRFHGSSVAMAELTYQPAYVVSPGGDLTGLYGWTVDTESSGGEGFPERAYMTIGDLALEVTPLGLAPILLEDGDRVSRFPRALCRFDADDGRSGVGWTEWNQPG